MLSHMPNMCIHLKSVILVRTVSKYLVESRTQSLVSPLTLSAKALFMMVVIMTDFLVTGTKDLNHQLILHQPLVLKLWSLLMACRLPVGY